MYCIPVKSTVKVLYPKLVPLSVIQTLSVPVFDKIPFTSQGAKNCPFFILTILSVRLASSTLLTNKSVCLHKNAGICNTSTVGNTSFICQTSCTSVNTLQPTSSLTSDNHCIP